MTTGRMATRSVEEGRENERVPPHVVQVLHGVQVPHNVQVQPQYKQFPNVEQDNEAGEEPQHGVTTGV